ncbi:MAG: hypothetical protein OXR07_09275, partial [Nitrospira sp.]|nr:hypothetical protein [Nitrospira sp.]
MPGEAGSQGASGRRTAGASFLRKQASRVAPGRRTAGASFLRKQESRVPPGSGRQERHSCESR